MPRGRKPSTGVKSQAAIKAAKLRENETPEQREKRLEDTRTRVLARLATETPEQRETRLSKCRQRYISKQQKAARDSLQRFKLQQEKYKAYCRKRAQEERELKALKKKKQLEAKSRRQRGRTPKNHQCQCIDKKLDNRLSDHARPEVFSGESSFPSESIIFYNGAVQVDERYNRTCAIPEIGQNLYNVDGNQVDEWYNRTCAIPEIEQNLQNVDGNQVDECHNRTCAIPEIEQNLYNVDGNMFNFPVCKVEESPEYITPD